VTPDSIATGAPLFRRIADALADAIARGDYPVGKRLPPEFTLMRMFGASRFTIREALVDLRSRGLTSSRRGSGTVVLTRIPPTPSFSESPSSLETFLSSVAEVALQPLEIRDIVADESLAAELGCEPGRQFLLFRGIRRVRARPKDPPLAVSDAYIEASYGAIRPHLSELTESIAGTAERVFGVRVRTIVQELEPMILDAGTAVLLDAAEGGAAMLVRRRYYLSDATMLLTSHSIYPRGRLLFRTELRRRPALKQDE